MEVLVADDDFVSRNLLKNMLQKLGHQVQTAEDGAAALEIIKRRDIRMVITDWMMPKLDGLALCRTIRRQQSTGYVFIILLTSKDTTDNIVAGLEAGADDYLCKPLKKAEFVARLNCGLRILDLETSLVDANDKVRLLSVTDDLTGCYNKRYLTQHLCQEIDRAKRFNHALSMVMTDIDHFKQVNDTYGHPAGDAVLAHFARCLSGGIRKNVDWLVRYGGEEFLIVLPETPVAGGSQVANRLRRSIERETVTADDHPIRITASFGVAGLEARAVHTDDLARQLIESTDRCLYTAKKAGRNRVCASEE